MPERDDFAQRAKRLLSRTWSDAGQEVHAGRFTDHRRGFDDFAMVRRKRFHALHQDRRRAAGDAQSLNAVHVRNPAVRFPVQIAVRDQVIDDAADDQRRSGRFPQRPPNQILGDVVLAEERLEMFADERLAERVDADDREVSLARAKLPRREMRARLGRCLGR